MPIRSRQTRIEAALEEALAGYVPFTGATSDLDLGSYGLTTADLLVGTSDVKWTYDTQNVSGVTYPKWVARGSTTVGLHFGGMIETSLLVLRPESYAGGGDDVKLRLSDTALSSWFQFDVNEGTNVMIVSASGKTAPSVDFSDIDLTTTGEVTTGILNTDDWDANDGVTNLMKYDLINSEIDVSQDINMNANMNANLLKASDIYNSKIYDANGNEKFSFTQYDTGLLGTLLMDGSSYLSGAIYIEAGYGIFSESTNCGVMSDLITSYTGANKLLEWDSVNSEIDVSQDINLGTNNINQVGDITGENLNTKIDTSTSGVMILQGTDLEGYQDNAWGIKFDFTNTYFPVLSGINATTGDASALGIYMPGGVTFSRGDGVTIDNDSSAVIKSVAQTGGADRVGIGVSADSSTSKVSWVMIGDTSYYGLNYIGAQADPALLVAANENDATSYGMFQHDRTDFEITSGKGDIELNPADYVVINSSKGTTGDPTGKEGMIYINTVDNVVKIYADSGWRILASW